MLDLGQVYSEVFSFTQEQVIRFAEVSGDHNPVHLDSDYASKTAFKKPIIHGILGTSIFSKILGMNFPGEGTIYLKQEANFKRPMYAGTSYEAILTILEVNRDKHQAVIETKVIDKETGKVIIDGQAQVMNKEKI